MPGTYDPDVGLLEKLLGPISGARVQDSVETWVGDPIRKHLWVLLNARQGSVEHLPDYGMPDLSSVYPDVSASYAELERTVQALILKYEPRLLNPRVEAQKNTKAHQFLNASLIITGEIETPEGNSRVTYRTTISRDGDAKLE